MPEHIYYAVSPLCKPPRLGLKSCTYIDLFTDPYYEPTIDRMTYGVVIYNRVLEPEEIAGSGLISAPRE